MDTQRRPGGTSRGTRGDPSPGWPRVPGRQRLPAYARDLFTAPFRIDPEAVMAGGRAQGDQERRTALLRLILILTDVILLLVAVPLSLLHRQPGSLLVLGLVVAFTTIALMLAARGPTTVAALVFICTNVAVAVGNAFGQPNPIAASNVLIFATLCLYILLGALVLPPRWVWSVTAFIMAATAAGLLGDRLPLSVGKLIARSGVLAQLLSLQLLIGIIAWVAARISRASVAAASQAFVRERELAALKDQFIIYANHELRTPVMTLYNNLELLEMLGEGGDHAARERALRRALASGDVVLRLLGNVLDAGVLEAHAPRVELRPVPLAPLVRAVLETFDPREIGEPGPEPDAYPPRAVRVQVPAEVAVWADEGRLRQVLINLLSNALKYSAPSTPIAVAAGEVADRSRHRPFGRRGAGASPDTPRMVWVSVQDWGLGVPPHEADKLFQRFVRLERDIAGSVRGTGVGLYLCRVLVEAMGGRIWVKSTGVPGDGSTFSFILPLAAAQMPQLTPTPVARTTVASAHTATTAIPAARDSSPRDGTVR